MIYNLLIWISRRIAAFLSSIFQAQLFVHRQFGKGRKSQDQEKGKFAYLRQHYGGSKRKRSAAILIAAMVRVSVYLLLAVLLFGMVSKATSSNKERPIISDSESISGIHFE